MNSVEDPKGEDFAPLNLAEIVATVRRHLFVLLVPPLLLVAIAAASHLLKPATSAASTVVLFNTGASGGSVSSDRDVHNEMALATGDAVRDAVRVRLGAAPKLTVSTPAGSNSFTMHVTGDSADQALHAVTTYAQVYASFRAQRLAPLERSAQAARNLVSERQKQIADVDVRIAGALVAAVQANPSATIEPDLELTAQRNDLLAEQETLRAAAVVVETAVGALDAPMIAPPTVTATSTTQGVAVTAVLAALGGLAVGSLLLLLIVALDETVRDRATVERVLPNATVLAECVVARRRKVDPIVWPPISRPDGFQALQAAVYHACRTAGITSVAVIACEDGLASTTSLARLGGALAAAGRRIIVVDADLANPSLGRALQLDYDGGLLEAVAEQADTADLLQDVVEVPGLRALTTGPSRDQWVKPQAIARVVRSVADHGELVLVDAPRAVGGTDGVALASLLDGVVVVVVADKTTSSDLTYTAQRLDVSGAKVVGVVLVREGRRLARPRRPPSSTILQQTHKRLNQGSWRAKPRSPVEFGGL